MTFPPRLAAVVLGLIAAAGPASAGPPAAPDRTAGLPRYDLAVTLDSAAHVVTARQRVTWTNTTARPADELILNFYPHYRIPEGDYLLLAKTLELLRLNPDEGIDRRGRHGTVTKAAGVALNGKPLPADTLLTYHFRTDNPTAIVFALPEPVGPGQSVTVELDLRIELPNKQGRWGHWQNVNYLTNALPVAAFYDASGWHAMPFVPWHQPFWNEAGVYTCTIDMPADEHLACSAAVRTESIDAAGRKRVVTEPFVGRDFGLVWSKEFQEFRKTVKVPDGREVTIKCLAFARHAHYAGEILKYVAEALPVYSEWFGPFPYAQLTLVESFFGWNGNECAGLILIDERIFGMPHLGRGYVEYLVSHETCHQWWYNLIGTNGYAETFMDEGPASYFTHKLLDRTRGKNNAFLDWPANLEWLPNIRRENYRNASLYGAIRRDQMPAAAGELPGFNHLVGLFTGAYDRGSKVFGMVEDRLGPEGFADFVHALFDKYSWGVLTAADLRAEVECHTGQNWGEFFERWVYGKGLVDWKIDTVETGPARMSFGPRLAAAPGGGPKRVRVRVKQSAEYDEPTYLGFQFAAGDGFPVRVPVVPAAEAWVAPDGSARVEPAGKGEYVVTVNLPADPIQVMIDPDRVLLDKNPGDNLWKSPPRVTASPLYSMLNETDLTNDYDRWNIGGGPWVGGALYPDPWYVRSTMAGFRAAAYRTQIFAGGVYAAFRSDYRDAVVGADGLFDHFPLPKTQLGYSAEARVGGPYGNVNGRDTAFRGAAFARYVFQYGSSLYLPPIHYAEAFTSYQDNFLPYARVFPAGAVRPTYTQLTGVHYRLNLYTPYWDPATGFWIDAVYAGGVAGLGYAAGTHQFRGELAGIKKLPEGLPGILAETRVAARVVAMGATPDRGQFFALGGGTLFRGFDLAERQGSFLWAANAELRLPIVQNVEWDALDHTVGARNVTLAAFYDAGEVYANGKSNGGVAHAVGAGVRVDLAIFSFIERATLRLDVAKTLNAGTPVQVWFGVQHPF